MEENKTKDDRRWLTYFTANSIGDAKELAAVFTHSEAVTQAKTVFQFTNVWDLLAPSGRKSYSAVQMNICSFIVHNVLIVFGLQLQQSEVSCVRLLGSRSSPAHSSWSQCQSANIFASRANVPCWRPHRCWSPFSNVHLNHSSFSYCVVRVKNNDNNNNNNSHKTQCRSIPFCSSGPLWMLRTGPLKQSQQACQGAAVSWQLWL